VRRIQNDLLAEDSSNGNNATKVQPEEATDSDVRDTGATVSQHEIELGEVRQAAKLIKALPYDGADSVGKMALEKDDIADLEYVSTWCANAVIKFRSGTEENDG
jgi:hypothetical protein